MNDDHLRIGDAERERAGAELAEHFAQGRLDATEHAERLDRVWAARTRGELTPVFRDLPGQGFGRWPGPVRSPFGRPAGPPATAWPPAGPVVVRQRGLPAPVIAVLGVLLVLTVLTHAPLIILGLVVWLFLRSRHHRHPGWGAGWAPGPVPGRGPGWDPRRQRRR